MPDRPLFAYRFVVWSLVLAVVWAGGINLHGGTSESEDAAIRTQAALWDCSDGTNSLVACHTFLAKSFSVPEPSQGTPTLLEFATDRESDDGRTCNGRLHVNATASRILAVKPTLVGIVEFRI